MKIQVGGLSQGSHSYNFRVQPADIGLDGHYTREVVVSVRLEKTATQLMLKAELSTEGQFSCDRCADEFGAAAGGLLPDALCLERGGRWTA